MLLPGETGLQAYLADEKVHERESHNGAGQSGEGEPSRRTLALPAQLTGVRDKAIARVEFRFHSGRNEADDFARHEKILTRRSKAKDFKIGGLFVRANAFCVSCGRL